MAALKARLGPLANVEFRRASADMRPVYRRTALLLVPSQVEEAFGRVVVEAQASGIPCLVRETGGLPEAVGAGGRLLPQSAEAAEWADAIEAILSDPALSSSLSAAAAANAMRPEFSFDSNIERFIGVATAHVDASRHRRQIAS